MKETLGKVAAWPGKIVRNISVATRLSLVVLLVALVSLVIAAIVGLQRGGEVADNVLRARISSLGAARADEVERYIVNLERSAIGQAISPSTAQAISDFADAYEELDGDDPSRADTEAVGEYYVDVVAPELSDVRGRPVSAADLVPRSAAAVELQANYVVPGGVDGSLINDANDGSRWSELHSSLHRSFSEFVIQNGVDDLYLIEPDGRTIVYSTAKNIDFATSLRTGPHSGSALAVLVNSFGDDPEPGIAAIRDFTSYPAAGDEPSLFVASPAFADGSLAGFVAMRIGPAPISSLTTDGGTWSSEGDTGETFVVARDGLMRTDARGFIEDQRSYIDAVTAAGTATERQAQSMETFGTTVLFQPVDDEDVDAALDLEPDVAETTNQIGADVLQARRALDIEGLDWAMLTEVEVEEVNQPVVDFARNPLIAMGLFLVAITFVAVRWSGGLLRPLRVISTRLRAVRAGGDVDEGVSSASLPSGSSAEFVELAGDIDTMLETLAARNDDAADRAAERRELLQKILPPQAAQRAEAGEQNVVDQVENASVAVVVVHGLGPLMRAGSKGEARSILDRFVEESDALAKQRGVERMRLTGDAYYATCGTVRPHIDHGARAVSFVLDVHDLIRDLDGDEGALSMSAGIDSGPVTVGLTGGSGLVYDAWGATVQGAADLARHAEPGEVLVSAAARTLLPSNLDTEDDDGSHNPPGTAIVTGRATDGAAIT
ncbi:MAG: adenylate/guanylate cyclase domain-containing protein [Ilumatobacteraceae bacterium]